ncbi:hypothetical protein SNE40_003554 [Patella caerulea]|uniref:Glycosyltransferase family 92 protein n=1 Tax=Patella caerulea TaxID=87958 RepID=A0AAN8KAZ9_PATCE
MYSDEILPIYDCMMRSSDYTFTAVLDFDEIIVPKKGPLDLIPMLNHEYQHDEHAAAFVFRIENFILNWTTSNETNLHFMKYVKRTLALQDQSKIVYVQGRYKTVNMHTTEALRGFGIVFLPSKKAAVHHYTVCRPAWSQSSCLSEINRHYDRTMMGIETHLLERLKMVPDDLRLGK